MIHVGLLWVVTGKDFSSCKSKQWLEREERASISSSTPLPSSPPHSHYVNTDRNKDTWWIMKEEGLWFWKECQSAADFPHWLTGLPVNWWHIFPRWRDKYLRRLSRVRMIQTGTNDNAAAIRLLLLAALVHQMTVAIIKPVIIFVGPLEHVSFTVLL